MFPTDLHGILVDFFDAVGSIVRGARGLLVMSAIAMAALLETGVVTDQGSPVTEVQLDRVVEHAAAFARLYGYVRFFHPSDEAAARDWDRFAVHGMGRVLGASDSEELASVLEELFVPLAPTLELAGEDGFGTKEPLPPPGDGEVVAWQHHGVGLSSWTMYASTRMNRPGMLGGGELARMVQMIPIDVVRGRHVRLRGAVRVEADEGAGNARLTLTAMGAGGPTFSADMEERPITASEWREYEVQGKIPESSTGAMVGAAFWGSGRAWVDAFELAVSDDGTSWNTVSLENPDFESDDGRTVSGWVPMPSGIRAPARLSPDDERPYRGATSGRIEAEEPARLFPAHPRLGEMVEANIGAGLRVRLPVALSSAESRTLPAADPGALQRLEQALAEVEPNARGLEDGALRLANVATIWAVFQHFFPYHEEIKVAWDEVLETALRDAAVADSKGSYLRVLKKLVADLEDGHARVFHPSLEREGSLPVTVEWIEDRVVVTASADDRFQPGDVVVALNGKPADEAVAERMALRSGSPHYRRHLALRDFGRGSPGEEVELQIRRDGEVLEHRVLRESGPSPREERPDPVSELTSGVYYVDLRRVGMAEIAPRLEELSEAEGVIFDVRGYPQGDAHGVLQHLIDEPMEWAHMCTPQTIYPDRTPEPDCPLTMGGIQRPQFPRLEGEAVFLTHAAAMSYAETFMGMVSAYELGEIVGQPTAGVNGNQNWMYLPGDLRINWTGMRVVRHDGSQHFGVGHPPTVPAERTLEGVWDGRDELLEMALDLVRNNGAP